MPRSDRIYAVVWTRRRHRIVPTKAAGQRAMKTWKRWYERLGWRVSSMPAVPGYKATNLETGEQHAIGLHEYDAVTKERLWEPRTPRPQPERKAAPKPRRGRKPAYA